MISTDPFNYIFVRLHFCFLLFEKDLYNDALRNIMGVGSGGQGGRGLPCIFIHVTNMADRGFLFFRCPPPPFPLKEAK